MQSRPGACATARRHAVGSGVLARPRRTVVAPPLDLPADTPAWDRARTRLLRSAEAAHAACPRAAPSHAAAAVAHDLPLLSVPPRACLTVPAGTPLRRLVDAHLHRATLTAQDVVLVGELPVTSPARTVLDVAREHGVRSGLVAADAALHADLMTAADLCEALARCEGWPGYRSARRVVDEADARAESPLETLSRLAIVSGRLPRPSTQTVVLDAAGRFLGRCDFYWDEFGVVGEADGDAKYATTDEIVRERRRQVLLEQTGLLVVRWGSRDVADFTTTASRLRDAFTRGARAGSPLRRWRTA